MRHYITLKNGRAYIVEFPEIIENGKTGVYVHEKDSIFGYEYHTLTAYYRHERTWDDHMGNTPCGYYCIVPFPNGERHRVYIY